MTSTSAPASLPQPRDVTLHQLGGGGRRAFAPELVDDAVARDHLARVQREQGEQRTLLRRPEGNGHAVHNRLQRPQHAELDHPTPTLLQPVLDAQHVGAGGRRLRGQRVPSETTTVWRPAVVGLKSLHDAPMHRLWRLLDH